MPVSAEKFLTQLSSASGDELLRVWSRASSNHAVDSVSEELELAAHKALDQLGEVTGQEAFFSRIDTAVQGMAYTLTRRVLENPECGYEVCRRMSRHFYSANPLVAFLCIREFEFRLSQFSILVNDQLLAIAAAGPGPELPCRMTLRALAFSVLFALDPQYKHWHQLTDARLECARGLPNWARKGTDRADHYLRLAQQMLRYTNQSFHSLKSDLRKRNLPMSASYRRQASLYLTDAPHIEELRTRFNILQAELIPAHVTLVREDEVSDWDELHQRLLALGKIELTLQFGTPKREGDLVYLPVVGGNDQFDELRQALLPGTNPRKHNPHLTLIHPRNGRCSDRIFDEIVAATPPFEATFTEVRLIEQTDGGPWVQFT